jgi:hypothetical protein
VEKNSYPSTNLQKLTKFSVEMSDVQLVNELFSKCFIKILYTGLNRNDVFITKEVAEQMATTLYNIPIVGEYVESIEDFKDHGGRIEIEDSEVKFVHTTKPYGFVPEGTDIEWKTIVEADGEVREYLTCWGYLWTGRYPEAAKIIEDQHPQSMELSEDSLEGYWKQEGQKTFFHITKAEFSALAILGTKVPPAFESASIGAYYVPNFTAFSKRFGKLIREFEETLPEIAHKKVVNFSQEDNKETKNNEGGQDMKKAQFTFELDHDSIRHQIYNKINPLQEDGSRDWKYYIGKVYDNRVIVVDENTDVPYRQSYKVENDIVEFVGDKVQVEIKDLTKEEAQKLEQLQSNYNLLEKKCEELEATKTEEKTEFTESKVNEEESEEITKLRAENQDLKEFKAKVDKQAKEKVILTFSAILAEDDLKPFKESIDNYTEQQLEEKLSVIAIKKKVNFTENANQEDLIPDGQESNDDNLSGSERIIKKHIK